MGSLALAAEPLVPDQAVLVLGNSISAALIGSGGYVNQAQILLRRNDKDIARLPVHVTFVGAGADVGFFTSNTGESVLSIYPVDGKPASTLIGVYGSVDVAMGAIGGFRGMDSINLSGVKISGSVANGGVGLFLGGVTMSVTPDKRYDPMPADAWERPIRWLDNSQQYNSEYMPKSNIEEERIDMNISCEGAGGETGFSLQSTPGVWKLSYEYLDQFFAGFVPSRITVTEDSERHFIIQEADKLARSSKALLVEIDASSYRKVANKMTGKIQFAPKSARVVRSSIGQGFCRIYADSVEELDTIVQSIKDAAHPVH